MMVSILPIGVDMLTVTAVIPGSNAQDPARPAPQRALVLTHDERHLRRRVLSLADGNRFLVDLPEPVVLASGDQLALSDGSSVEIVAADEALYAVMPRDPQHLIELAWHIGNRHLAAAISVHSILILRDHVIKTMLEGLGARVREITAPFNPVRGAYSGSQHNHGHGHDHGHDHQHDHDHGHHHA